MMAKQKALWSEHAAPDLMSSIPTIPDSLLASIKVVWWRWRIKSNGLILNK
jgi:hypothetical protein